MTDLAPDVSEALRAAHQIYRTRFAWQTDLTGTSVALPLGHGICALTAPSLSGCRIVIALRAAQCLGPVFLIPGPQAHMVFLAEPDGAIHGACYGSTGLRLLPSSATIPMPPTRTADGDVRWINPPHARYRWLPTCSTILHTAAILETDKHSVEDLRSASRS